MSLFAGSLAMLFAGCERSLIYYPANPPEEQLQRTARSQGLEPWRNDQGERIGWVARADSEGTERTAVIVFHGNAGHAANRAYYPQGFSAAAGELPWDIFILEYPGYGSRPGSPSESAIKKAARSAVDGLLEEGYSSLFLVGESLGSGVASHLAAELPDRIRGLLLVTPFTSLQDVARSHYPNFVVSMLLSERYDNVEALSRYEGPVAVLLAERDEVVPAELGRRLYESYEGPKKLWVQKGRTHNTLSFDPDATWWSELIEFLQRRGEE